ncbi:methyl-accepting chemotaxis protein [Curvibacter sp. RS43]|uniref:methyl-accepting chemotaxis protein n=1 Tax=Curvibacter microcysteis TaxID=3026419 RepID=UPI00236037C1|nr:methyl-accepting chemotaxis protein [Curvibacter sp. RS43]MDD0811079.1 methyl-accepting chemotaxis protein [Curvibacter sp. RS43]
MNLFAMMRMFTIRFRMIGAIAVVLSLLGLLGGAGMLGMFRIQSMSEDFMTHSYAAMGSLTELRAELAQVRRFEKDMIIQYEKPEAVKQLRAKWLEAIGRSEQVLKRIAAAEAVSDKTVLDTIAQKLGTYRDQFSSVANQLENSGYESATTANRMSGRAVSQFEEGEKALAMLEKSLTDQVNDAVADQARVSKQTQLLFVAAVVITVVVVVPLTLLNMQSICRPLEVARHAAQAIAGGDLSRRIDYEGKDEVSDLLHALSDMQAGLGAMVSQVRDASENIATASHEIASGNTDLSGRTEQTASNVQVTVSSINDLTGNVQQTASSAQLANQLAASASGAAVRGGTVVRQAVSSMHQISASSRKINDIIGLIDSIAFQTNILALNAAVEAARAGEQGRGFAVVASEVRGLAQRSAQAASEIKGLIQNSVTAVDGGVKLVEDAGSAMDEIVGGVQRVTDIIGEITAAASEQSNGIGNVNQSVAQIDQMTQQNAALVEQSAAAAESLREQADRLASVVRQFRLSERHSADHATATATAYLGRGSRAPSGLLGM